MKASELIEHLQKCIDSYGDREILFVDGSFVNLVKDIEIHPESIASWEAYIFNEGVPEIFEGSSPRRKPKGFLLS